MLFLTLASPVSYFFENITIDFFVVVCFLALQALLGHTDAVTCLTASSAYRIVVSGSRDRTCIIWDLNKLSFVTQLRGHRAPVSALCINELTVSQKTQFSHPSLRCSRSYAMVA